jgi:hypothetical protein
MKENDSLKSLVMRCMVMRLTERESLEYFKEQGYEISSRQFYRIKKNIRESRFERLSEIAKGFIDHHLQRMDTLELVNYEMWRKYRAGDYKALDALSKIAEAQPLISNYYDATKLVVEDHQAKIREDKEFREHLNPAPGMNHVKVDDKGDFYWAEPGEDIMDVVSKTDKEITEFKKKYLKK